MHDEWIGAVRFQLITADSIAVAAEAAGSSPVVPARFQSMLRLHYAGGALPRSAVNSCILVQTQLAASLPEFARTPNNNADKDRARAAVPIIPIANPGTSILAARPSTNVKTSLICAQHHADSELAAALGYRKGEHAVPAINGWPTATSVRDFCLDSGEDAAGCPN